MNPKAEIFFDAITLLREDIVEEAQNYRFRREQSPWKKIGSLAACLALIASISLLTLPKGCGGSAPNMDMNSGGSSLQGADSCAPVDTPASCDTIHTPSEAPAAPEDGYGEIEPETVQFTAVVIEIDNSSILVEPLESENLRLSYDRIVVATRNLELPELAVGDEVRITYDGRIQQSEPAGISGAAAIERLERN